MRNEGAGSPQQIFPRQAQMKERSWFHNVADGTTIKPDPEDAKVDRIVRSIRRGC